ncbi:YdcF family protein [Corynebacterium ureicelerivorans]|uniref:YdcF family protein n=1 Tax=Corynebacterium ureicelerivorans TaxID=401472 RepID=UPI00264DB197|nr:YdcF family protein [Corynebacterium ureicelerivorans]MDN8606067.1 YdcF family protein [Corynebacterium ureicelerivorans]
MSNPIVVLGARVIDGRPSRMLESRLCVALEAWQADPRPIVVSGYGEAGVMAAWLVAHGVPETSVVAEPYARSTNENLERSRALFPGAGHLTVVTSGFHVPRTRVWAWHLSIPVRMVAAPTPKTSRTKNLLREVVALPHSVTRVVWRRVVRRVVGR